MQAEPPNPLPRLVELLEKWFGGWATYTAFGSFVLYFFGYLSLRFQLHALGVTTDLNVLDERYFFAGARFLLYVASSIPIFVMISALFLPPVLLLRIPFLRGLMDRLRSVWSRPLVPVSFGIILSLILIQGLMRSCFPFSNLLLAPELPDPAFLRAWLLHNDEGFLNLFFALILGGTMVSGAMLYAAKSVEHQDSPKLQASRAILSCLLGVELLLLPVNHGMLIVNRSLPRLSEAATPEQLRGREAWFVWEGAQWTTYLSRDRDSGTRRLLALPRQDLKLLEIDCQDPILRVLYLREPSPCSAVPREKQRGN